MDNQINKLEEEIKTIATDIQAKQERKKKVQKALKELYKQANKMKEVLAQVNAD